MADGGAGRQEGGGGGELYRNGSWGDDNAVAVPDDRRGGGELYRNGSWGDDNAVAGAGRQEGESYTGTGVGEMITLWRVAVPDDRRGGGAIQERELGR